MLGLKLNHVSKRGHRSTITKLSHCHFTTTYSQKTLNSMYMKVRLTPIVDKAINSFPTSISHDVVTYVTAALHKYSSWQNSESNKLISAAHLFLNFALFLSVQISKIICQQSKMLWAFGNLLNLILWWVLEKPIKTNFRPACRCENYW